MNSSLNMSFQKHCVYESQMGKKSGLADQTTFKPWFLGSFHFRNCLNYLHSYNAKIKIDKHLSVYLHMIHFVCTKICNKTKSIISDFVSHTGKFGRRGEHMLGIVRVQ